MTVIFKLGGSLLTLDGFAARFRAVLELRPQERRLIVVGGGAVADVVREWSRIHHLQEEEAHWLAISSLDLNRRLLQKLLGYKSVEGRLNARRLWDADNSPLLLNMTQFLSDDEPLSARHLPRNWDVTSDSLAAWTAQRWPADELVLVKSISVPNHCTADKAATNGFVDAYFPQIAGGVRQISWCNLQVVDPMIDPWITSSSSR
jgi:aspartokinase-like uncharacterized kinase